MPSPGYQSPPTEAAPSGASRATAFRLFGLEPFGGGRRRRSQAASLAASTALWILVVLVISGLVHAIPN